MAVMAGYPFISYSGFDGADFAIELSNRLSNGEHPITVWLDKDRLRSYRRGFPRQLARAIEKCESLIFVMTRDSVEDQSVCTNEWLHARNHKKPIICLRLHRDAEIPILLNKLQYIDFTDSGKFDEALDKLRRDLRLLASSKEQLEDLEDSLADAQRDLRRATTPEQQARIEGKIKELQEKIAHQQRVVENPQEAERGVEKRLQRGMQLERQPRKPASDTPSIKSVNPPPGIAPAYFQDRDVETNLIGDFLKDEALRLITVVGRSGIGKTVMACRLLKSLEGGRLPDDGEPLGVDGIVYLSEIGSHRITVENLYSGLCKLLPEDVAERLENVYKDPQATTEAKMRALLEEFPVGRYVLLLDNFENVLDPETHKISDAELDEALRALLSLPHHAVRVIVTTRFAPRGLALVCPERQRAPLRLDEGLPSPYAENILRKMDVDGKLGLKTAPEELLDEARQRTSGNPRALEHLFAILSEDWDTSLREILDDTEGLLPEEVFEVLVGEAFDRLDPAARMVMQALAIYARPVPPSAIDYLLQPHLLGLDSAPVLKRLVNMQLARKEAGRYYLHELDRAYALSRMPRGEVADREETEPPPFTQFGLLHRAADYFEQVRMPQETWRTIEELSPQLAEFDLRYAGRDYDRAASVLLEIDSVYFFSWGHSRLAIELHERLQGKLNDPLLQQDSAGNLGAAYLGTGQIQKAITYLEHAVEIAREIGSRGGEAAWLGNLATCYSVLGQTNLTIGEHYAQAFRIACEFGDARSAALFLGNLGTYYSDLGEIARPIECYELALEIAREFGTKDIEAGLLGNLGSRYAELGQNVYAIEYYKQALEIARKFGERGTEASLLGNLGCRYSELGQKAHAIECCEQALEIAREFGKRPTESHNLRNLGDLLVRQGEWEKAAQQYKGAIQIADENGFAQLQNEARYGLALAYLYGGDLTAARAAAETARQYDVPQNNANVRALLGVIALRQGDPAEAQEAFEAAVNQAEALLGHSERNYAALDSKGLALCGLALCQENSDHIPTAINAYRSARTINKDAGIVGDVLRLFDALAQANPAGMLAEVRAAAAGI